MKNLIPIKEVYKNLKKITKKAQNGESFTVLKHSKPVFKIIPPEKESGRPHYTLDDFKDITFSHGDNLSKKIDELAYGAKQNNKK